jgi:hypothetical protein
MTSQEIENTIAEKKQRAAALAVTIAEAQAAASKLRAAYISDIGCEKSYLAASARHAALSDALPPLEAEIESLEREYSRSVEAEAWDATVQELRASDSEAEAAFSELKTLRAETADLLRDKAAKMVAATKRWNAARASFHETLRPHAPFAQNSRDYFREFPEAEKQNREVAAALTGAGLKLDALRFDLGGEGYATAFRQPAELPIVPFAYLMTQAQNLVAAENSE